MIVDQVITIFYKNCRNPLNWLYPHTERILPTSSDSRRIKDNCLVARNWIKDYIRLRREGKRKSDVRADTDILTLMLGRPDVFTDEFMVDELLGFFGAATETTHNVTQTILTHLTQNNDSLAKVRSEYEYVLAEQIK